MTKKSKKKTANKTSKKQAPPPYERICEIWSYSDHWPLMDAIHLLLKIPPAFFTPRKHSAQHDRQRNIIYEIALNCAGDSLTIVNESVSPGEFRVLPDQFLEWARKRDMPVPMELFKAVESKVLKFGKRKPPRKFGPKQQHRERCKGIAALLWSANPDLTKAKMAARPEILKFGCEGEKYTSETIQDWIKTEKPNRSGGRPKKES